MSKTISFNLSTAAILQEIYAAAALRSLDNNIEIPQLLTRDHQGALRLLIKDAFAFLGTYNPLVAVVVAVGIALGIYIVGTIVELIRQGLFRLLKIDKLVEVISNFIVNLYDKIKFPSEEK